MSMGPSATGETSAGALTSDINVTPMVDIMLVLLIIFMVITPLLQSGVPVNLPSGDQPDEDPNIIKETSVVVAIPTDGVFYVGRDLIQGKDKLIQTIKTRMSALKPTDLQVVYIKGGTNVSYGQVVEVVDPIHEAGYDQLGLVAEKKKPGEQ
jgi:biopolymer transport protein ExbD/biopolymer transport protein TolR